MTTEMNLVVKNHSTLMSNDDLEKAVDACAAQIKLHVAPAWDLPPPSVTCLLSGKCQEKDPTFLVIFDDSDTAGALGYHKVSPEGKPYGRVFVGPLAKKRGKPLSGKLSFSSSISHEICEWFVDPQLKRWVAGPDGEYPVEICDAVEDTVYELQRVSVSNFVTRHFYDPHATETSPLDHMKVLKKPFTTTPGGYIQVRKQGVVKSLFGARYAHWKHGTKEFPAARTYQRQKI